MKRAHLTHLALALALVVGGCSDTSSRIGEQGAMRVALEKAFHQDSHLDRIAELSLALPHLNANNLEEAEQVFERESWWLTDVEIELFMEAWTRFAPEAARDFAEKWPERIHREAALGAVIRAWARQDPTAAAIAAKSLNQAYPKSSGVFFEGLVTGWVESGQPGVVDHVAKIGVQAYPIGAVFISAGQVRRLGVPGALEWADGVVTAEHPDKLKLNIFRRITGTAARLDPAAVAVWVKKHEGQDYTNEAPRILIERWISIDPEAALDWVAEAVPAEQRESIVRTAFTKWLLADRDGAGEWVQVLPSADRYDPVFHAYAVVLAKQDGEAAIEWAERILDDQSRRSTLTRVASFWYQKDPVDAEAWLATSELNEQMRESVRKAPARGTGRNRPRRQS